MAYLACVSGFVGLMMIVTELCRVYTPLELAIGAVENANFFILAGTYRVLIKDTLWAKWQVILTKLTLLAAMVALIYITMVIIRKSDVAEQMKDFFFVYIFGVFSLYYELYNKITELDGTGELHSHYTNIKQESEEEEVRLNTQNEGTRMMLDEEIRK